MDVVQRLDRDQVTVSLSNWSSLSGGDISCGENMPLSDGQPCVTSGCGLAQPSLWHVIISSTVC
jgi:hypothetical protein